MQEMATENARTLQQGNTTSTEVPSKAVNQLPVGRPVARQQGNFKCSRCGGRNHSWQECPFKYSRCHNCGKMGHLKSVCRAPRRTQMPTYQNKPENIQQVQEPPSERDEYTLYQMEVGDQKPFKVHMQGMENCYPWRLIQEHHCH